jgi:integrase
MDTPEPSQSPGLALASVRRWLDEHEMDLDERRLYLVHVVLSRLIGQASGDRAGLHNLTTPLAALATFSYRRGIDTELVAAPFTEFPPTGWPHRDEVKGWPQGDTVLRTLRISVEDLDQMWRKAIVRDHLHAALPVEVVCGFLPPPMWRMTAEVIEWGPAGTGDRLLRFCMEEAMRPSKWQRSGGTISRKTIRHREQLMRRLMRILLDLNNLEWRFPGEATPCRELAKWTQLPPKIDLDEIGAEDAHMDRTAPPLRLVRLKLNELLDQLAEKRSTKTGRKRMLGLYRDALLLSLLVVLGARIGAIRKIRPCDFRPNWKNKGPAIRLFPAKTLRRSTERWKPIPDEVAELVLGWFEFTGLDRPEHAKRVIWMGRWSHERAFGVPGPESSKETLAQAAKRLIAHETDPLSDGYSAHTYRHLAEQLARIHGHHWLDQNPEARRLDSGVLADALLDHAWGESDLYGYNDLEPNREHYAGEATKGIWELVHTERGARTAPDWERRTAAQAARDEAAEALERCAQRIADLKTTRSEFTARLDDPDDGRGRDSDTKLILQVLTISMDLDEAYEQRSRASEELRRAEQELQQALGATIPIADELTDAQHRALQDHPPAVDDVDPADLPPVRNWLTYREVAEAWGKSPQTVKNWFNGLQNPPFNPVEAVEEPGPRKRRLNVDKLDLTTIDADVVRRIRRILARPPAKTQRRRREQAPAAQSSAAPDLAR